MSAVGAEADKAVGGARVGGYRWVVICLVFIVYTAAFADRANIGIALPHIKAEFHLSNTQAGLLVSAFAFAYAAAQIPAAFVIGKLGVRRGLPAFMVLTSLVTFAIGASASALFLVVNRVLLGLTEAPLAIAVVTTLNNWFPRKEKGTAAGILLASTKFGPLLVPPIGAVIMLTLGWRWVFYLFAIPSVLLALAWALLVADEPRRSRFVGRREADYIADAADQAAERRGDAGAPAADRRFRSLDRLIRARPVALLSTPRQVFASRNVWGVAVGYFFVQGIVGVILAWLPTYLTEVKKYQILSVGFVSAVPFAGAVLGNLLGGTISDRLLDGRRKPTMLLSCASTIVMMYWLTAAPSNAVLLAIFLFATGFLLSIGYSAFTIYPARLTTRTSFPFAVSFMNTGGQLGTALIPLATGAMLDAYGWNTVFLALAFCSLGALIVLMFIDEPVGISSAPGETGAQAA